MTQIQIPVETVVVEVSKKDGIKILESQGCCVHTIDDNAPALCDMCSVSLGAYKDVKHMLSPEMISKAVERGYRPQYMIESTKKMLKSIGQTNPAIIKEIIKEVTQSWVDMTKIGETPWALCDKCYAEMQKFNEEK